MAQVISAMIWVAFSTLQPSSLVLELRVPQADYVLYEPVILQYDVRNPTTETIPSAIVLDWSALQIKFLITGPDGVSRRLKSPVIRCAMAKRVVHEPGSVMGASAELGWTGRLSAFPSPGPYTVQVILDTPWYPLAIHLESEPIQIQIRKPVGADAQAISYFDSEDEFVRLLAAGPGRYCRGSKGPVCFEEVRRFLAQHHKSAYAPTIAINLASAVRNQHIEVEPRHDLAVDLYREFLERWPTHPLAPKSMYALALCLDRAGRVEEAAAVILRFEAEFPAERRMADALRMNLVSGRVLKGRE